MTAPKKTTALLLQLTMVCTIALIYRMLSTGYISYIFMLWNLFLAWIPYLLTSYVIKENSGIKLFSRQALMLFWWLMFLPNAPYLLTDLVHLSFNSNRGFWFDLLLILSFAFTGLLLFLFSVQDIRYKVLSDYPLWLHKGIVYGIFLLCGYGLYLGRCLRFNSWDVVTNPFGLIRGVFESFFNPLLVKETIGLSCLFALFLYFGYKVFTHIPSVKNVVNNEPESFN